MADDFEEMLDAGAKSMLAALAGDDDEYQRQIERGREAYQKLHGPHLDDAKLKALFAEDDRRRHQRKRQRPVRKPAATTNLGDLLKAAGAKATDDKED